MTILKIMGYFSENVVEVKIAILGWIGTGTLFLMKVNDSIDLVEIDRNIERAATYVGLIFVSLGVILRCIQIYKEFNKKNENYR